MLVLFAASGLALLALLAVLNAQWLGHVSWSGLPLLENAWPWALVLPLLALAYFLVRAWYPRARAEGAADRPLFSMYEDSLVPAAVLRDERILSANHAFWRHVGPVWSESEMTGVPFASLLHPYDHKKFEMLIRSALKAVATASLAELRMRRFDGASVVTRISATATPGADGAEVLIKLDVAAPSQSVTANPPAADEAHRFVTDNMEQVAFQIDSEGQWIFLNPYWEKLTGFHVAESLAQPFVKYVHPDEAARNTEQFECLASGVKDRCWDETRLLTSDGGFRWVSVRIKSILSEEGRFIGAVGTLADITRKKMNEESLKASQHTLAILVDNFPGMIYRGRCDRTWTMEFVSDGCFGLTGYEACELVDNLSVSFNQLIHPDDREFVWRQVWSKLAQNKPYEMEYRVVTKTGETKWVWEHGCGVYATDGELLALDGFITDITARKRSEDEARRNLLRDELTGLYNGTMLQDRLGYLLNHAKLTGSSFAVLCLELDNFKQINVRHGRETGDRLLAAIGKRLERILQHPANMAARLGSDEFAVLLTDLSHAPRSAETHEQEQPAEGIGPAPFSRLTDAALALRVIHLVEALQRDLSCPITVGGSTFIVSACVGMALSLSEYDQAEDMLRDAVEAAHRAKFLGGAHYAFADQALHGKALNRRHIELPLMHSFDSSAFHVFYVPVVDLASGRVAWLEPMLRWLHPRRGWLEFEAFRVIAEDTGLLGPLARWLVREVCGQARRWDLALRDQAPPRICISLTGRMLADKTVVHEIERVLEENRLAANRCVIQVKDIDSTADSPEAQEVLIALRDKGGMIVVDDDGQGLSGPLSLKSLIASLWKVDCSRVQSEDECHRLKSVIAQAKAHGVLTIAAGLKTDDMLSFAENNGFVYGEGPVLAEPIAPDAVPALMLDPNKRVRCVTPSPLNH